MPKDRKLDRSDKDWDHPTQTEGLASRIKFTPPEKTIVLRPQTEEVIAEVRRGIKWDELIDLMVEKGIVAKTDEERTFIKKSEGLGEEHGGLEKMIEKNIKEEMEQLDIRDPEKLKKFLQLSIRESVKGFYGSLRPSTHQKLLELIPAIAEAIASVIELPISLFEPNRVELCKGMKGDSYMTIGPKISKKALEFFDQVVGSQDMPSYEHERVRNFFSNLSDLGSTIAQHKYNCRPEEQENWARNF